MFIGRRKDKRRDDLYVCLERKRRAARKGPRHPFDIVARKKDASRPSCRKKQGEEDRVQGRHGGESAKAGRKRRLRVPYLGDGEKMRMPWQESPGKKEKGLIPLHTMAEGKGLVTIVRPLARPGKKREEGLRFHG